MNPNLFPQPSGPAQSPAGPPQQFSDPTHHSDTSLSQTSSDTPVPLENILSRLLAKPEIPRVGKDLLAEYFPWLALVVGLIMFPIIITGFLNSGIFGMISSTGALVANPAYWAGLILFTGQFILSALSVMKLVSHTRRGWRFVFWSSLLGVITAIANIFAGFIDPLITTPLLFALSAGSLYLLVQIRGYYTD